jgi:multidrug resistance efflux pump
MKFFTRIRFLIGILFVLLIVGLLILYLNNALSTVHASRASLESDALTIGTDYGGLVVKQAINDGDPIKKGQTLFEITSSQLTANIANGSIKQASLPFSIDPKSNDIVIKAPGNGVVQKVNYLAGSFVPSGGILATVDTVGTSYIAGHFHLSPRDYARVKKGNVMDVTFPDNNHVTATVQSIALTTAGNRVDTVVKARLNGKSITDFQFPVGTPVEASLKLTKRAWYQDVTDLVRNLFKPANS